MDPEQNEFFSNSGYLIGEEEEGMRITLHGIDQIMRVLKQGSLISIGPLNFVCVFKNHTYTYDWDTGKVVRISPDPFSDHYTLKEEISLKAAASEIMQHKIYLPTDHPELLSKINDLDKKVFVTITAKIEIVVNEKIEISKVMEEMYYTFKSETDGAVITHTEIEDFKIYDSK